MSDLFNFLPSDQCRQIAKKDGLCLVQSLRRRIQSLLSIVSIILCVNILFRVDFVTRCNKRGKFNQKLSKIWTTHMQQCRQLRNLFRYNPSVSVINMTWRQLNYKHKSWCNANKCRHNLFDESSALPLHSAFVVTPPSSKNGLYMQSRRKYSSIQFYSAASPTGICINDFHFLILKKSLVRHTSVMKNTHT